jgi:hypothetical protein
VVGLILLASVHLLMGFGQACLLCLMFALGLTKVHTYIHT